MIKQMTYYDPDTGEIIGHISGTEDSLWFWLLGTQYWHVDGVYDGSEYIIDTTTGEPVKREAGSVPINSISSLPSFPT